MYMRVTRTRTDPARVDEANPVVQETAAAIKQLPGFQSLGIGTDRATGEGIAVTTWDTEEHARLSRDVLLGEFIPRLQALGVQLDPPQIFEVTAT
jgi:hypothetical protein